MTFHVLGLIPVAVLAGWAWSRFRWRGLIMPALLVLAGQIQFDLFNLAYLRLGYFSWFDLAFPAVAIVYAFWFKPPKFTGVYFVMLFAWALITGVITEVASIVGWWFVSAGMWLDNR